jgi:ABC-type Zn uptake system ZnuABC Zn-binding protein ZnuA
MDSLQLSDALAEAVGEQEIKRILVQRRASRLVLTEAKDETGKEVRGKVFVDSSAPGVNVTRRKEK